MGLTYGFFEWYFDAGQVEKIPQQAIGILDKLNMR
jgi:hypothetical protein